MLWSTLYPNTEVVVSLSNALWGLAVLVGFVSVTCPPLMIATGTLVLVALKASPDDTVVRP